MTKLMASEEGEEMRRRAKEMGSLIRKAQVSSLESDSFITHITR